MRESYIYCPLFMPTKHSNAQHVVEYEKQLHQEENQNPVMPFNSLCNPTFMV